MSSLLVLVPITLFFIFAMAVICYATLGIEKAPTALRPIVRHVAAVLDSMGEAMEEERRAQLRHNLGVRIQAASKPVEPSEELFRQRTAAPAAIQNPREVRFFALHEMAISCKLELRIEGSTLLLKRGELARLEEYCTFAFEVPTSAATYLNSLGMQLRKV